MLSICDESLPGTAESTSQFHDVTSSSDNPLDIVPSSQQSKQKPPVNMIDKAQECFRWLGFVEQVLKIDGPDKGLRFFNSSDPQEKALRRDDWRVSHTRCHPPA